MKAQRLKILAMTIWAGILLIGGALVIMLLSSANLQNALGMSGDNPTGNTPQPQEIAPSPSPWRPTWTPTSPPQIVYLPSATARPVSPTPIQPTNTPVTPLAIALAYPARDGNPLTGLKADPNLLNRRPIAVKISTFPRGVRAYQSGLSLADVAYEYYIEDGLTRFIAVFYGHDAERAGPVRSGRYFDEHIMRMYRSALVFASADERVETHLIEQNDLRPLLFIPRPDNCPPLCRDTSIRGYNNVFVDTAGVGPKLTDNSKQALRSTFFGPLFYPAGLKPIQRIYTHYSIYSYGYWEYDPGLRLYKRYSDAQDATSFTVNEVYQPHIDNLNGQQIIAQNVAVLVAAHNFNNDYDRADQVFNINLSGAGRAYLFREGHMVVGSWVRDQRDQPLQLMDDKGQPFPLQPGVTFFQVINQTSTLQQNGTTIEFFFAIPPRVLTPTVTPFGFEPSPTPKNKK